MEFGKGIGIPCLDFSKNPKDLVEGSEGWKKLCKQVREASEEYGCFQVVYDNKVPVEQHEDMFMALKDLFDLPVETKKKNIGSKGPYGGYIGKSLKTPLFENLGIEDPELPDTASAFTNLMWPGGNPGFCKTLDNMSKMMIELEQIIHKMIFESYGVKKKHYESNAKDSEIAIHLIKYSVPSSNEPAGVGANPHTDKSLLTILDFNLPGLEVLSKDQSTWIPVAPRQGAFTIFIGDQLKVWSNGRLHIAPHKVTMRGDKERYSYALFVSPKAEAVVEAQPELVDEDHPIRFRPFKNIDFLRYYYTNIHMDNALQNFAAVV